MDIKWQYGIQQHYTVDTSGLVKPDIIDISQDRDYDLQKRVLGKRLRELKRDDPDKLMELLSNLSEEEADALLNDPMVLARDKQLIAFESPYTINVFCCGRGFNTSSPFVL